MLVVVPRLREHLRPETFNPLTVVVFWACEVLQHHYLTLFLVIGAVLMGLSTFVRTSYGRELSERFKLRAPIFGKIFTMVAICRFCRILGTMLHNGVPILQALKISKDSAGNSILAKLIEEATREQAKQI